MPPTPDGENGENGETNGLKQHATYRDVLIMLVKAQQKLSRQNIKTAAAVRIRDEVSEEITEAILAIQQLRDTFADNAATTLQAIKDEIKELAASRITLTAIEQEIRDVKTDTKEIKASTDNPPARTWAQLAADTDQSPIPKKATA
jgi:hypothetical protein